MLETTEEIIDMLDGVRKRPCMWISGKSYDALQGFLGGFDTATRILDGFREWLILKTGHYTNCYYAIIALEIAFPELSPYVHPIPDEKLAIDTLYDLAIEFLRYKEEVGLEKILADYQAFRN